MGDTMLYAYAAHGCHDQDVISDFHEHDSGSACMNVDTHFADNDRAVKSDGRILSIFFTLNVYDCQYTSILHCAG